MELMTPNELKVSYILNRYIVMDRIRNIYNTWNNFVSYKNQSVSHHHNTYHYVYVIVSATSSYTSGRDFDHTRDVYLFANVCRALGVLRVFPNSQLWIYNYIPSNTVVYETFVYISTNECGKDWNCRLNFLNCKKF